MRRFLPLFLTLALVFSLTMSPVAFAVQSSADEAIVASEEESGATEPDTSEEEVQEEETTDGDSSEEAPPEQEPDGDTSGEALPDSSEPAPEEGEELPDELDPADMADISMEEEALLEADKDPIHIAINNLEEAVMTDDTKYSSTKKLTAATFSNYSNSTKLAAGASISYNRLVTLKVTGLKTGASNAHRNSLTMTHVMKLVQSFSSQSAYSKVMFKVVVPGGKYYLDYSMYLYSNTWLSMKGVTFYKGNLENKCMARGGSASDAVSGYNGEKNIVLEGGTWDVRMSKYSASGQSHFGTLRFGHSKNIILANVTCSGAVNGHQLELCGVSGVTVVGCTMKGYLNTAYHSSNDYKEAIQLDIVNNSSTCPTYSKYDDTVTGNVVIYKNTFSDCCRGVGSHSAIYGKTYSNVVIQSNTFKNLSGAACHLLEYQKTAVVNNTMTKVGAGVELLAMCKSPDGHYYAPASGSVPAYSKVKTFNSQSVISGNKIQVNTSASITLSAGILVGGDVHKDTAAYCKKQYGGKSFTITGVTVKNNTVTAAKDAGIFLRYANSCTVSGNTIKSVVKGKTGAGYGIQLSNCGFNTISSNTISGTKSHGMYLASCTGAGSDLEKYLKITKNKVTTTGASNVGIYVYKSKYIRVYNCTVSAKTYAVQMNGCSYQYIGSATYRNTLKSKAKYGVYANGKSKTEIKVYYDNISATKGAVSAASGSKIKTKSVKFTKVKV